MRYLLFYWGCLWWHCRAALWFARLGFRLYFAVGLDQDFDPARNDLARHFRCPLPRTYRRYLEPKQTLPP